VLLQLLGPPFVFITHRFSSSVYCQYYKLLDSADIHVMFPGEHLKSFCQGNLGKHIVGFGIPARKAPVLLLLQTPSFIIIAAALFTKILGRLAGVL
jgi:hypothetical protein